MTRRKLGLGVLLAADPAVLVDLRRSLAVVGNLAHPRRWVTAVGADGAAAELASAALWVVAAWVAMAVLSCLAARLPGGLGRASSRFAAVVVPRTVVRVAAGATGLGVLLAPVAAQAAEPSTSIGASAAAPSGTPSSMAPPAPVWPTDDPIPVPAWPTTPAAPQTAPHRTGPAHQAGPPHRPGAAGRPAPTGPHAAEPASAREVVVRPGDSLWSIAAEHLPSTASARRIAAAWPRWYATNRRVVGADPDLIHPGQILHRPPWQEPS